MENNLTPSSSVDQSPLFRLPPELRDMIYEYAFSTNTCARVTKEAGILEPALLSTCKVVRDEAIAVFYGQERLILVVRSYDPSVMLLWDFKRRYLARNYDLVPARPKILHQGAPMWVKLRLSLQLYHGRKLRALLYASPQGTPNYDEQKLFIGGLFEAVRAMRDRPWEEVRGVLDRLRPGLVGLDNRWARWWGDSCDIGELRYFSLSGWTPD
jgi:hypothetical protein